MAYLDQGRTVSVHAVKILSHLCSEDVDEDEEHVYLLARLQGVLRLSHAMSSVLPSKAEKDAAGIPSKLMLK